ncbi:MAG TPA: YciI family protein [Chitinophagaceae bacterium]|nr:YciI family protein [Chitinophagaceae bacterium]
MKEFALLFRQPHNAASNITPKDLQALAKKWQDWLTGIEAGGKMASHGARLDAEGKVLRAGGIITDGPFVEIREQLGGLIIVKAENIDEATTIAHGCPALDTGGSVEIRPIFGS